MDIRYSANQRDVKRYTTEELRREFLIENLYHPDEVVAVYSHIDRMVTLGCMPVREKVSLEKGIDVWASFGTHSFLERREIGIFNIGGSGTITVDGTAHSLNEVVFHSMGEPQKTRHIVMHNEQTVPSTSWSIHAGVGTGSYTFIWAMGGENQAFDDMDGISTLSLR